LKEVTIFTFCAFDVLKLFLSVTAVLVFTFILIFSQIVIISY